MSILDTILGALRGQSGGGSPIAQILGELLKGQQEQGGQGLFAILDQFRRSGLGDKVDSWIGTGANIPMSSHELGTIFSGGQLGQWAEKFGISKELISEQLAQHLPELVDKLSPNGQLSPDLEGMATIAQDFLNKMNRQV